jgi:nucleoid-associated protein YgaU
MSTTPPTKIDFSNVASHVSSSEQLAPDFGNVRSGVTSTSDAPVSAAAPGFQHYTVVRNDTLSGIAKRFYGKASRWPAIFEANRDQVSDPDRIRPGQVLKIPADDQTSGT